MTGASGVVRKITVAALNDENSSIYSGSNDGNGSGIEAKLDRALEERPETGWRQPVGSGAWK